MRVLLWFWRARATLSASRQAAHSGGFPRRARALDRALGHGLSSSVTGAWSLRSVGDLPGPETQLVSPALTGGFLTPEPPGKHRILYLNCAARGTVVDYESSLN